MCVYLQKMELRCWNRVKRKTRRDQLNVNCVDTVGTKSADLMNFFHLATLATKDITFMLGNFIEVAVKDSLISLSLPFLALHGKTCYRILYSRWIQD